MKNKKESIKIYTKGLPINKAVAERIYEFGIAPLYNNFEEFTGYYRITIPAIAINKEQ